MKHETIHYFANKYPALKKYLTRSQDNIPNADIRQWPFQNFPWRGAYLHVWETEESLSVCGKGMQTALLSVTMVLAFALSRSVGFRMDSF